MGNIKVSIVTVCYNSVATLEQTIKSIIGQRANVEYIIIDGGSTDGTIDIIKKYEKYISYWASSPDKGIYDAMNKGVHVATGDLIAFMNSDDWYEENILESVVKEYQRTYADVIFGDVSIVQGNHVKYRSLKGIDLDELYRGMFICHQAVFIKTALQKQYPFDYNYKIGADYKVLLQLYSGGNKFVYLNQNIAFYRMEGFSGGFPYRFLYEQRKAFFEVAQRASFSQHSWENLVAYHQKQRVGLIWRFLISRIMGSEAWDGVGGVCFEIVIFGTGVIGREFYTLLDKLGIHICCFLDNNMSAPRNLFGVPVFSANYLEKKRGPKIFIGTTKYEDEICHQLSRRGLERGCDYFGFVEVVKIVLAIYLKQRRIFGYKMG